MIWGFTLHPGEPCTKTVDKEVHLTMAALDGNIGINDATKKKCCQVLMVTESSEFLLLCTLVEGLIYQQNVDLQLMPGERVTFCAQGGRVHLTGYSQVTKKVDVDHSTTDVPEPSIPAGLTGHKPSTELQAQCERDVIEELFSEQDCTTPSETTEDKAADNPKKDQLQKEIEIIEIDKTTDDPGEDGSKDGQELGSHTTREHNTSPGTSRAHSPVECIDQALSITYIPSDGEEETASQSLQRVEIPHGQLSKTSNGEVKKGHLCQEGVMVPAQSNLQNISPVTQAVAPGSQLWKNIPDFEGIIGVDRGVTQSSQGREVSLPKTVNPNVSKATENYQYEVGKVISKGGVQQFPQQSSQNTAVPTASLLGTANESHGEKHPQVKEGTSSPVVALDSHLERKRPHPGAEEKGGQNPLAISITPMDTNIQAKKSRLSDRNIPTEVAASSQASSITGVEVQKNSDQMQTLFGRFKLTRSKVSSERQLQPLPLKSLGTLTAPETAKLNTSQRYKCDCCMMETEYRQEIMLGDDKHWFCRNCFKTFSNDVELLRYCRIVHQAKHK